MRKSNKEINDAAVIVGLLNLCHVGRLGTIGLDGWPMIKPLNFCYHQEKIYFHSALEGEKIDDIKRDSRVCFEVDLPIAYVMGTPENPCKAEYLYRSIIIKGQAFLVKDDTEKVVALRALMEKYQPEGGYGEFLQQKLELTAVVGIEIDELVGKEDLGNGDLREKALKALEAKEPLPVVIAREG